MSGGELHALASDLSAAGARVRRQASQAVRRSALELQSRARLMAPVDTGFHRSAIHAQVGELAATVSADAHYAIYLEYGTSRMPPYPSIMPAADAVEPGFYQAMEQIGADIL